MGVKTALVTLSTVLALAGTAGAWGLPTMASLPSLGSASASSGDPDVFLAKAKKSETLIEKSSHLLFKAVASKEEQAKQEEMLKKMNQTSDPQEKNAQLMLINESESATIQKDAASKAIQQEAKNWDAQKKEQVSNALYNFSLGALQAGLLVPEGKAMASSIAGNPVNAARMAFKLNSVYDSLKSIGGILVNSTKVVGALKPLMLAANIQVKLPTTATDKPVDASNDLN
jgi:hypothetical protein